MVDGISSNNNLSAYFTNLIENLMTIERQPLNRLTAQRDQVTLTKSVYIDLQSNIDSLRNSLGALTSTSPFFSLKSGRTSNVANATDGATVVSASAGNSAVAANYDIKVQQLATADRKVSTLQANSDQALGKEGKIWLGGTGTASSAVTDSNGMLSNVETPWTDGNNETQHELGTGAYTIETQLSGGVLQFRLKDADNNVVAIEDGNGNLSKGWQSVTDPSLTYDTGRGLKLTFSSTAKDNVGSALSINYTAAGASITLASTDTLADVAKKINEANQPDQHTSVATVIGKQLVLTAGQTGTAHTMIFSDLTTGGSEPFNFQPIDANPVQNAKFSVNGINFETQSNTNLSNVINGVSLNLAADATYINSNNQVVGRNATLVVSSTINSARNAISDFISNFNSLQGYLADKTGVTQQSDNTYKRGALADDSTFSELRSNLFSKIIDRYSNSGAYKSLSDIGITIDENLQISISDSAKLDAALNDNMSDVNALMDSVMNSLDSGLSRFGGSNGYLNSAAQNLNYNLTDINVSIKDMNARLDDRKASLYNQYSEIQAQLMSLSYLQQTMSSFYGTTSTRA